MASKFKVGDRVHCYRKETWSESPFDFEGVVLEANDTGDEADGVEWWEYKVTNAPFIISPEFPLLIWEHEMYEAIDD